MLLDKDQLERLTGHKRVDAQVRELQHLGIPFRQRRDGSLVVLASDVDPPKAGTMPAVADFEVTP